MEEIIARNDPPQNYFGSDFPRVRLLMLGTGESPMRQDRSCKQGITISPI